MNPFYLLLILLTISGKTYLPGKVILQPGIIGGQYHGLTGEGYADSCCLNSATFTLNVRNALSVEIVDSNCQAKLIVQQLPACDSVYFIDWGDGELDYGPFSNGVLRHTYPQTGQYTIQVPVVEFDAVGDPCFDTLMKFKADVLCHCECGNYSMNTNLNGVRYPLHCGDVLALACPAPDSLNFSGFFDCMGNSCSITPIQWTLNGPGLILSDSLPAGGFEIRIPALTRPGDYELTLLSQCGMKCECSVTIHLSPCLIADVCADFCAGNTWSHFNAALIRDMVVYNGILIAAGSFTTIGREELPVNNIAAWDGTTWTAFEGGGFNNKVNDLEIHDGILFAGGEFTQAGDIPVDKIAAWNGFSWTALSQGGINGNFTNVDALLSTSGGLIVGGKFSSVGDPAINVSNIAAWNPGTGWVSMGSNLDGPVFALTLYQGKIVAGGRFGNIPEGLNNVAWWNGVWTKFGVQGAVNIKSATPHPDDGVHTLAVYNDQLVVGGQFISTMIDSAPNEQRTKHIAQWNGTRWSPLGSGTGVNLGSGIYSLNVVGDELIAGGQFTRINLQTINHLAKWDGIKWTGFLHPATGGVRTLTSFRAPDDLSCTLYTGGELGINHWTCSTVKHKDQINNLTFSVFPNPASHIFYLDLSEAQIGSASIEIYSALGQKMFYEKYSSTVQGGQRIISIEGWESGVYLIKVSTTNGTGVKKVLIRG